MTELIRREDSKILREADAYELLYWVAVKVRDEHEDDVYSYLSEGHSIHDCVEINSKVVEELRKIGIDAELVRLDPDVKHYVALARINNKEYIVDAVPELSGLFDYIISPIVIEAEKVREAYPL